MCSKTVEQFRPKTSRKVIKDMNRKMQDDQKQKKNK